MKKNQISSTLMSYFELYRELTRLTLGQSESENSWTEK